MNDTASGYAVYWKTWGVLLVLTAIMFFLDSVQMPRTPFVLLMLTAMTVKAVLIAAVFMHLAKESLDLVIGIAASLLGCGIILWWLMVVDARRILEMVQG